jgi:hypothetical protein
MVYRYSAVSILIIVSDNYSIDSHFGLQIQCSIDSQYRLQIQCSIDSHYRFRYSTVSILIILYRYITVSILIMVYRYSAVSILNIVYRYSAISILSGNKAGNHWIGGREGPRAGLYGCEKSCLPRGWIPGPSSPWPVAILTALSRPTINCTKTETHWWSRTLTWYRYTGDRIH